jgi:hypothetical protein
MWYVWRKPCTYHAPKLIVSPKGPKGDFTWPTSPKSSIGCVQNNFWGYVTFGANCGSILDRDLHYLQIDRNKILHDPRHLGVLSGASRTIFELTVHSAQTVQLWWIKISTVSKCTETRFHSSLVTHEYLSVHLKQFLSLWYVWGKPCTYHAPKPTLSPKGPKGDSTWPMSPRSSIGCVQNDFWGYGTFGANHAPILHWNERPFEPRHPRVPSGASKQFLSLWYVWRKPCTYHALKPTLSPKGPKRASIWASSPRSTIRCVQNNFWGYAMFGANYGSILHRD